MSPNKLDVLKAELRKCFPTLRCVVADDQSTHFTGTFIVRDDDGPIARYAIDIALPESFPHALPVVRELDGRVPRELDRHVNNDGTMCIVLPAEYWSEHTECKLVEFLRGPVRNFFISQIHFDRFGTWPFGERAHGTAGRLDFLQELLGTREPRIINNYLCILAKKRIAGHWPCPCGSKEKLRRCHGARLRELHEQLPQSFARETLRVIKDEMAQEAQLKRLLEKKYDNTTQLGRLGLVPIST